MAALLRGPAGSALVLTVARPGLAHARAVYLERRPLPQPPVKVASCFPQFPAPCLGLSDLGGAVMPDHMPLQGMLLHVGKH